VADTPADSWTVSVVAASRSVLPAPQPVQRAPAIVEGAAVTAMTAAAPGEGGDPDPHAAIAVVTVRTTTLPNLRILLLLGKVNDA
jgi:hypothetical protein